MATQAVVLCADDYGMNAGVSRGILDLVQMGRVSATSCMANAPDWPRAARDLAGTRPEFGVGLHITLTWGRPLGAMPKLAANGQLPTLGALLKGSLAGRLPKVEIAQEIDRQLDVFCEALGRPPDFVDGHQHVHVLPGIRGAVFDALARRSWAGGVWLRDPSDRVAAILARRVAAAKAVIVGMLATGFRRDAHRAGFSTNESFSGFSLFDPARDVGSDVGSYLSALGRRPLVMCHPGRPDPSEGGGGRAPDGISGARLAEHAYLASQAFADLLARRAIILAPAPA